MIDEQTPASTSGAAKQASPSQPSRPIRPAPLTPLPGTLLTRLFLPARAMIAESGCECRQFLQTQFEIYFLGLDSAD